MTITKAKHNNLETCIWMLEVIELITQVVHPKNANYLQAMTPRKCVHVGVQITSAKL
jgi:hypothetical protein